MRILIISDPITPPSYAPRVMSFLHYLREAGHDVVLEAGELPQKQSTWQFMADKLWGANDRAFGKVLLKKYAKGRFDTLLCSTYYYFPIQTAMMLHSAWKIPFVLDLRDIVEQWGSASYFTTSLPHLGGLEKVLVKGYEWKNLRLRNRVMNNAKAVVTVSPWHQHHLQSLTHTPVHLVYNGYDEKEIYFEEKHPDAFSITFIGRIMGLHLRQPHLLLQAVGEMLRNQEISQLDFRIDFYAEPDKEQEVRALARDCGAEPCIQWHPYVSRDEIRHIMAESSVVLALSCSPENGQHGILGTKVFEAIGAEKPLLLVPSDEDSLAELIRETGIGCAARNVDKVKFFVREQYAQWQQNGFTQRKIVDKEKFNRQSEVQQIEAILSE